MYLKVEKDSPIYGQLSQIFIEEDQRNKSFKKWMTEHLPPFNGESFSTFRYILFGF